MTNVFSLIKFTINNKYIQKIGLLCQEIKKKVFEFSIQLKTSLASFWYNIQNILRIKCYLV